MEFTNKTEIRSYGWNDWNSLNAIQKLSEKNMGFFVFNSCTITSVYFPVEKALIHYNVSKMDITKKIDWKTFERANYDGAE